MNIQGFGGVQQIAQTLMKGGVGAAANLPQGFRGGPPSQLTSITNDQGQSLVDIRGELQSAVKDAVQGFDGSTDFRSAIEGAIDSTLAEHGFDPAEVKGAMQEAGMGPGGPGPMRAMLASGGAGFDPGFDPASMLSGGTAEDVIQSFLQQFRAGTNLDVEI